MFNIAAKTFAHCSYDCQHFSMFMVLFYNRKCLGHPLPPLKFSYRGRVIAVEGIFDPVYDPQ